jgi:uncharacterized protein (TIGR02594 family)
VLKALTTALILLLTASTNSFAKQRYAPASESYILCDERGCRQSNEVHQAPKIIVKAARKTQKQARRVIKDVVASGDYLVDKARHYLGTNPTGWNAVWCGKFMAMVAPEAAAKIKNPNRARDWASLPHVSPQVGAIAVFARGRNGGHVGIVTGFEGNNPIIVSGNDNRLVREGVHPARLVIAYVSGA